jgi:2-oxo-4-hydroxy-4-carboxy-5-ureidoimidazoline decarboxylase
MAANRLTPRSKAEFIGRFGHIFEHSPWVVEDAWERRPFADEVALHAAFMEGVEMAGAAAQLKLLNAHPELAAKVELTEASEAEQKGAGLKHLTAAEFKRFSELNAAYREKFQFPFIICVRLHSKATILQAFEARLENDAATERREAIAQIGLITQLRLGDLLEGAAK